MNNEPEIPCMANLDLRDYFAAKAMAALVSNKGREFNGLDDRLNGEETPEEVNEIEKERAIAFWFLSLDAYKIADAMLREREVRE